MAENETIDLSGCVVGDSVIMGPDGALHPETKIGAENKLKVRINEMVYSMVDGVMTIDQFEELTVDLHAHVEEQVRLANSVARTNKDL